MLPNDLMFLMAAVFQRLEIAYAVTGSVASTFYGEMRTTNDVDIVADIPPSKVAAFVASFDEDDFYLSVDAVQEAIKLRSQFNIIHPSSGLKVDVIIPADSVQDRTQLQRARRIQVGDQTALFASPEDVILKKLWFYDLGGSEKHLRDIAGMLTAHLDPIDRDYVSQWAAKLKLDEIWRAIIARVDASK